jgi:hypothetical protein
VIGGGDSDDGAIGGRERAQARLWGVIHRLDQASPIISADARYRHDMDDRPATLG